MTLEYFRFTNDRNTSDSVKVENFETYTYPVKYRIPNIVEAVKNTTAGYSGNRFFVTSLTDA